MTVGAQSMELDPAPGVGRDGEQSRARYPDSEGFVVRDGARLFYEIYGEGPDTVFLLPTWSLIHSRHWKMQIAYLARRFRVLVMDGLGNGRSDRCRDPRRYDADETARDCLEVMDATDTESAVLVALSKGTQYALELGRLAPERVAGAAFVGPLFPYTASHNRWLLFNPRVQDLFERPLPTYRLLGHHWWGRMNAVHWRQEYPEFAEWFITRCLPEPHSTKAIEDATGWALDSDAETLIAGATADVTVDRGDLRELAEGLGCPVLVVHGDRDKINPPRDGRALARLSGGRVMRIPGSGHMPHARKPVQVNLALRAFSERAFGRPPKPRDDNAWRPDGRPRALFVSSPIGLGHARRDIAIARELRRIEPDIEIDWLAQDPVTRVLAAEGEAIHPASAHLANESHHIECESAEHDLHAFQAIRRMDEILAANFMLFHEVANERRYDLWIGDEAWELDYYLHENPKEKRAPFAWLTDFVGFLPMPARGEHEEFLTTDLNAEMIEHIARHPSVRDRAIFIGDREDVIARPFGPGLPEIRAWTEQHYAFAGYVPGFDPRTVTDRAAIRSQLGYEDGPLCLIAVGGSGVGAPLLHRVIEALPAARERIPGLRAVAVAGPRIDPLSLPQVDGLEVRGYVHELYRHLAACDVAVVQGGLTTTMELVAAQRPFISIPLASHFEQRYHVRNRLDRFGATEWLDYADCGPESMAAAIAAAIDSRPQYRTIAPDGASRAASLIAEVI
jgi:pimeloyl-ACP methyl ester carboxylesterase/predicted glycosyltransferase